MGFSVATTVLSAAASSALTDLATVRDELGIKAADTGDNVFLGRAIQQVSGAIARFTKRTLMPERVCDAFDIEQDAYPAQTPGGFRGLQLTRWPVLAMGSVTQAISLASSQPLTAGRDYRVDAETGELLRLNPFTGIGSSWEAVPVTVTYTAGFGAIVRETVSVPVVDPYSVTVARASEFSCDVAVTYSDGVALATVVGDPAPGQYSVAAGVYVFNAGDAGDALTFTYAVRQVPADLEQICLRLITSRYKAKGRDPNLIQRDTPGVGTERWWFGGAPGQTGPFPPDISAELEANYRTPTLA